MARPRLHLKWHAPVVIAASLFCLLGCDNPSEETRQNRRLVDALLTAATIKSPKQLERCKVLLDERKSQGHLTTANHKHLTAVIEQAKAGKWSEAEDALYAFRESQPFPK